MKKRLIVLTLTLCLLLAACTASPADPLPADTPAHIEPEPTTSYDEQYSYGADSIEPQEDDFAEDITGSPGENQMTLMDRLNLVYEWLELTCEEQRWTEDFTYDVRRPFEELTDEERTAQGRFRLMLSTFRDWTPEHMVARGFVLMCCNREVTCPVYGNTPNPAFVSGGSSYEPTRHLIFANWYAAFLYAGGYDAGFETIWDDGAYDVFIRELRGPY